jgi:hypothetical protein
VRAKSRGKYLELDEIKKQEDTENCVMRSLIIFIPTICYWTEQIKDKMGGVCSVWGERRQVHIHFSMQNLKGRTHMGD